MAAELLDHRGLTATLMAPAGPSISRAGRNCVTHVRSDTKKVKKSVVAAQTGESAGAMARRANRAAAAAAVDDGKLAFGRGITHDDGGRHELCSSPRAHPEMDLIRTAEYEQNRRQQFVGIQEAVPQLALVDEGVVEEELALRRQPIAALRDDGDAPMRTPHARAITPSKAHGDSDGKHHHAPQQHAVPSPPKKAVVGAGPRPPPANHSSASFTSPKRFQESSRTVTMPPVGHYRPKHAMTEHSMRTHGLILPGPSSKPLTPRGTSSHHEAVKLPELPRTAREVSNSNMAASQTNAPDKPPAVASPTDDDLTPTRKKAGPPQSDRFGSPCFRSTVPNCGGRSEKCPTCSAAIAVPANGQKQRCIVCKDALALPNCAGQKQKCLSCAAAAVIPNADGQKPKCVICGGIAVQICVTCGNPDPFPNAQTSRQRMKCVTCAAASVATWPRNDNATSVSPRGHVNFSQQTPRPPMTLNAAIPDPRGGGSSIGKDTHASPDIGKFTPRKPPAQAPRHAEAVLSPEKADSLRYGRVRTAHLPPRLAEEDDVRDRTPRKTGVSVEEVQELPIPLAKTPRTANLGKMLGRPAQKPHPDVTPLDITCLDAVTPRIRGTIIRADATGHEGKVFTASPVTTVAAYDPNIAAVRPHTIRDVVFDKTTPRTTHAATMADLVYAPKPVHERVRGNPMISHQVSRDKREKVLAPKQGPVGVVYDVNPKMWQLGPGGFQDFGRQIDRHHHAAGRGQPSQAMQDRARAQLESGHQQKRRVDVSPPRS